VKKTAKKKSSTKKKTTKKASAKKGGAKKRTAKKASAKKSSTKKKSSGRRTKVAAAILEKAAEKASEFIKTGAETLSKTAEELAAKARAAIGTEEGSDTGHPLVGTEIPSLALPNQSGEQVDLRSLSEENSKVVLYFYPKDDTPGCTTEACSFRDNMNRVEAAGVKVVGVSPDSPESHRKFINKYGLNFDLLSDTNHKLADAMKVWKEKNFMGKNYMGIERSTFLIEDGHVVKAWQPVKVEGHVDEVLNSVQD
jgi:peroxiredoxin Q/BCP